MRKFLISWLILVNISFAGIPVFDGISSAQSVLQNVKQIVEWAKGAKRWAETQAQYIKDLKQQAEDFATKSGIRRSIQFLKQARDIYSEAKRLGTSLSGLEYLADDASYMLSHKAKSLMTKYFEYDPCKDLQKSKQKICYQRRGKIIEDMIFFDDRTKVVSEHVKDINKLISKMQSSKDIKESADIQNAITAKASIIDAERAQIELYNQNSMRIQKALEEKQREKFIEACDNYGNFLNRSKR